jgi:hypothetical protein
MAMARELVTEKGIGENAAAVWKELQKQQAAVFGVRSMDVPAVDPEVPAVVEPQVIVPSPAPVAGVVTQLLMFGASLESVQRRKPSRRPTVAAKTSNQLALFLKPRE